MKKQLFTALAAGLMMTASATAADTFKYGYCSNEIVETYGGVTGAMIAAIEIPADVAASLAGCKLVGVEIGWGSGTVKKPTIFICENELNYHSYTPYAYKPKQLNGGEKSWNEVTFNTPYEITETPFFVGYFYGSVGRTNLPIGTDGVNPSTEAGSYYGWGDILSEAFGKCSPVTSYGNVSLRLIIEGEISMDDRATVRSVSAPILAAPGQPFDVTVNGTNDGTNEISSVAGTISIDGVVSDFSKTFETPVKPGDNITFTLDGLVCDSEGQNLDITAAVTTVNGNANNAPKKQMSTTFACSSSSFARNVVVEEFTGVWCVHCIRGYAGMEYMNRTYPDTFIGIAIHGPDASQDNMYSSDFASLVAQVNSYPNGWVNREATIFPTESALREAYAEFYKPCFERVKLEAVYTDTHRNKLNIRATTEFATSLSDIDYALTFVITRDHVGPALQATDGSTTVTDATGAQTNSNPVLVYFDDVATQTPAVYGIAASRMTEAAKGDLIEYNYTMPLEFTNSDPDNINLIALLIDRKNDTILNATKMRGTDIKVGVLGDSVDNVRIEDDVTAEFYNLQGVRVEHPSHGIFIRRVGDRVDKVKM